MDDTILDDWFTKSQAATFLQVSEKTIERLARKHARSTARRASAPSPAFARLLAGRPGPGEERADAPGGCYPPRRRPVVLPTQGVELPSLSFNRSYLVRTYR